jgi:hypothetical protein
MITVMGMVRMMIMVLMANMTTMAHMTTTVKLNLLVKKQRPKLPIDFNRWLISGLVRDKPTVVT